MTEQKHFDDWALARSRSSLGFGPSCSSSPPVPQARHSTDQSVLNRVGPECSGRRTESGPGDGTAGGLSDRGRDHSLLTPLYAALPESHAAAQKEHLALQDLAKDEWILFARRVHPVIHDAIMDAARREGIAPKRAHDIITPQEAIHLVSEHVGVAILTKPTALGCRAEGVVVKPLSDESLCFKTCVIMRTDDDSRLANEFARSFLRRFQPHTLPPKQLELSLSP